MYKNNYIHFRNIKTKELKKKTVYDISWSNTCLYEQMLIVIIKYSSKVNIWKVNVEIRNYFSISGAYICCLYENLKKNA